ncbi:cadherin EGF LAG seven-pass G-type receptor 2 isoform X2 [Patella vulgata]|nr:cadherin EGF LAG seven-pass G-type receptor 2 isoform X2 [Patella vulgata]XP_050419470.1 cadherin EGF LAG seven-pass G-type receptor 2 isoform X2 [Patella vulgata]
MINKNMGNRLICLLVMVAMGSCVDLTKADLCDVNGSYEVFIRGIREDTQIGEVIYTINFAGTPNEIILQQAANSFFDFDPQTRNVTIKAGLDRETQGEKLTFKVSCKVNTTNAPTVDITVNVLIVDVNDNSPNFTVNTYYLNISEDVPVGQNIVTNIKANDSDPGQNGQILYDIVQGQYSEYFEIEDKVKTVIRLNKSLDYEQLKIMTLNISAKDQPMNEPALTSMCQLVVTVLDADDSSPEFTKKKYTGSILNTATPGTKVNVNAKILATDPDVTINSPVKYSLYDEDNVFEIDGTSGEVKVKQTPTAKTYSLMVEAIQVDNSLRKGTAILQIRVLDSNTTSPPMFERTNYYLSVPESTPILTTILTLSVKDNDIDDTVTFALRTASSIFDVNPQSGDLLVKKSLDYETQRNYTLQITATDDTHTATATVKVTVSDVNDNNPSIVQKEEIVAAQRQNGAILTTIMATDQDESSKLSFVLRSYTDLFAVSDEGVVSIIGLAEELKENSYALLIEVSDNGIPPRKESKIITVEFSKLPVTGGVIMAGGQDDTLAIVFGVLAAIMFIVIIVLLFYIFRKREEFENLRRQQSSEHLSKAKLNRSNNPKGLAFKSNPPARNNPGLINIDYHGNIDETSDQGATTIQENPFNDDRINYGYVHSDSETDRDMDEIHIETSVIPYDAYKTNSGVYRNVDDHPINNNYDSHNYENGYENGSLGTFKDSISSESINSESVNSKKALVGGNNKRPAMHMMSWDNNGQVPSVASMVCIPTVKTLQSFDNDVEIVPIEEKPEITVYF